MKLESLIGKKFKYISKYDGKECDWVGIVDRINVIHATIDIKLGKFIPEIHIISTNNQNYKLNEIIFLDK